MTRGRIQTLAVAAGVFLVAILPFARCLNYGIINCDDYDYVTHAQQAGGLWDVREAIWMPLTWASYKLDFALARGSSRTEHDTAVYRIMHVHSVLLHGANAVLLFLFLLLLTRATAMTADPTSCRVACALAALVWAVHPLRCESVVWVASRKDVLSMLFLLGALSAWVVRTKRGFVWISVGLFLLGAMCKPSVLVWGPLVVLIDWLLLRKIDVVADVRALVSRGGAEIGRLRAYGVYLAPLVLCGALAMFAAWAQGAGGALDLGNGLPLQARLVNAGASFGLYVKNTVWPIALAPLPFYRWPAMPRFGWPGIVICGIWLAALVTLAWKGRRGWFVGALAWYAVAVVPFLGLKAFGSEPFADRFTYIPAVGFSLLLVPVLRRGWKACLLVGTVVALAVGLSLRQTGYWQNDGTLFTHCVEVEGDAHAEAWGNLGLWHFEHGHHLESARDCFARALRGRDLRLGRVYPIYFFTAWELGDEELMRTIHQDAAGWDSAFIANRGLRAQGITSTRGYLVVHALWLTRAAETRNDGQAALRDLAAKFPQCGEVLYAQYLAGMIRKEQVCEGDAADYVRYRFLGGVTRQDML